MTIEYASEQQRATRLLTRRVILFKTSGGVADRTGWYGCGRTIGKIANNIFPVSGVIQMEPEFGFCGGGIHADVP
jgi:hypothetical protein